MRPVNTKADFYARWERMEFGNRPQTWDSFDSLEASGYRGSVALRYNEVNAARKAYNVPAGQARSVAAELGGDLAQYRLSEQSPLDRVTLQGELTTTPEGLYLAHSHLPRPMRDLRDSLLVVTGLRALCVLQRWLDPADLSDLRDLVASYPDHVIEFGVYRHRVGVCHRRMMVWEVRSY